MSINLLNPETIVGKIDAAGNFVAQIRLAITVGDKERALAAVTEAERHISNALEQCETMNIE